MLADVVGLMLAFFVLSFSMREFVPIDPAPAPPQVDAVAVLEAPLLDQLRSLERERAARPSFAYVAAIIEANSRQGALDDVWHDDTRLVVRLPGTIDSRAVTVDPSSRDLLLSLAFLARRFDLDLTVEAPRDHDESIERLLQQAAAIRAWLVETVGLDRIEITYNRRVGSADAGALRVALDARPVQLPATAATRR